MLNRVKSSRSFRIMAFLVVTGMLVLNFTYSVPAMACSMSMEQEQRCCCPEKSAESSTTDETISKYCSCSIKEAATNKDKNNAAIINNPVPLSLDEFHETSDVLPHYISASLVSLDSSPPRACEDIYLINSNLRI